MSDAVEKFSQAAASTGEETAPAPPGGSVAVASDASSAKVPYKLVQGSSDDDAYPAFFRLELSAWRPPSREEEFFAQTLNSALEAAKTFRKGTDLDNQMVALRDTFAKDALTVAERFLGGENALQSIDDLAAEHGAFKAAIKAMSYDSAPNRIVRIQRDDNGVVEDIQFSLRSIPLSEEQEELFVEIQKVATVIRVVFASRLQARSRSLTMQRGTSPYKRGEYLQKLADIAMAGLTSPEKVRFARLAMQGFKNEFVALEADLVKNQYVRLLGRHVLVGVGLFLIIFVAMFVVPLWFPAATVPSPFTLFPLLAAGACVGTWLSFAIRRVILEFEDLALLEDDRLDPTSRLFFVVLLTLIVGLLIVTKMIGISIGEVPLELNRETMAILIGLLCGISERALAGVVKTRSDEFVGRVGGTIK